MNLKTFVANINKLLQDHPEAAEFEVITSIDDEGNGFNRVHFEPGIGEYCDNEFNDETSKPNAVCLN